MSTFRISGPFKVPVESLPNGRMVSNDLGTFWEDSEAGSSRGCYVFAIRAGKGYTPVYVGKTTKSFGQECFTPHKLAKHYGPALLQYKRGSPVMFFVVQDVQRGRPNVTDIAELEKFLIRVGVSRNPGLSNASGTKQEAWSIPGVLRGGRGKPNRAAQEFKRLLDL